MERKPRRPAPRPRDVRGRRLTAGDIRRARQQPQGAGVPVRPFRPAVQRTRPGIRPAGAPPPPSQPPPPLSPPAPKVPWWRGWSRWRIALITSLLLVAIPAIAFVLPTLFKAQRAYNQIFVPPPPRPVVAENPQGTPVIVPNATAPPVFPDWTGKDPINILLLGADTNAARQKSGEPALSDTIIIVSINPVTKQVGMMSIPRDLLVPIPGVGSQKINAAFSIGSLSNITGPGLVRATIEYNFHVQINYFAQVDFQGFRDIINTLGGVTLDVPAPIKDDTYPGEQFNYTRIYFHTGLQHMDGQTALEYVRTRHDDNDFARGVRQQQLLTALRQQAINLNLLPKAPQLIEDLGNTIRTDVPPGDLIKLAKLGTEIKTSDIRSYSILPGTTEQSTPQGYYLIPDWTKIREIVNQMIPPTPAATPAPAATPTPSPTEPVVQQPDLRAQVLVENGTHIDKLAARSAAKLNEAGFFNVNTAQASDAGQYPKSEIVSYSDNLATARLIAQLLGLPEAEIVEGNPANSGGNAVTVILGDDASVPGS